MFTPTGNLSGNRIYLYCRLLWTKWSFIYQLLVFTVYISVTVTDIIMVGFKIVLCFICAIRARYSEILTFRLCMGLLIRCSKFGFERLQLLTATDYVYTRSSVVKLNFALHPLFKHLEFLIITKVCIISISVF